MVERKPREVREMHPALFIPPDVEDIVTAERINFDDPSDEFQSELLTDDDNVAEDDDDVLSPPEAFWVVGQEVRISPGGGQVVDLIIEVEDMPEVDDFEVRKTKV